MDFQIIPCKKGKIYKKINNHETQSKKININKVKTSGTELDH